jgi:hypothetical protein
LKANPTKPKENTVDWNHKRRSERWCCSYVDETHWSSERRMYSTSGTHYLTSLSLSLSLSPSFSLSLWKFFLIFDPIRHVFWWEKLFIDLILDRNTSVGHSKRFSNNFDGLVGIKSGPIRYLVFFVSSSFISFVVKLSIWSFVFFEDWLRECRNAACLGGNIYTASPISDINPILIASVHFFLYWILSSFLHSQTLGSQFIWNVCNKGSHSHCCISRQGTANTSCW